MQCLRDARTDILVEANFTFEGQPEKRGFEPFRHKMALPKGIILSSQSKRRRTPPHA
jgi:hypothetical protein